MTGLMVCWDLNEVIIWFEIKAGGFHDFENNCFQKSEKTNSNSHFCTFLSNYYLVTFITGQIWQNCCQMLEEGVGVQNLMFFQTS